jgi:hypothetical protein
MNREQLAATAYHEAGHAVIAFFNNVRFKHATIVPGEEFWGRVLFANVPKWFQPDLKKTARIQFFVQQHIVIDFAGQLAQGKVRGRRPRWGMDRDNHNAVNMESYFCGSKKTLEAYRITAGACRVTR